MTRDKAQKRAIRARMRKTGERYTTARHFQLDRHRKPSPELPSSDPEGAEAPRAPSDLETSRLATLPPRHAEPEVGEEAVRRATGQGWDEWFRALDAWQGTTRDHATIARWLGEHHGLDGWWAQSVTVGYERARGMRAVHERPDGFSVGVSRTFPVALAALFAAVTDETIRDGWLDPGTLHPRTAQPNRSARFEVLTTGTRLNVYFTAKDEKRTTLQLQHEKLPDAAAVETWRAFWKERLSRLAAALSAPE